MTGLDAHFLGLTELWHIFHSELDLDGNGRLDAEELSLALKKAGQQPSDYGAGEPG